MPEPPDPDHPDTPRNPSNTAPESAPAGTEAPLHQPHDLLFRSTFSDPANARGLLKGLLPRSLKARIRWETLRVLPCSFIDPALAATESDLVFRFVLGDRECCLLILLEHQSTEDPFMPCRLSGYILRLWDQHRREHPGSCRLPPVFPLVLYQGAAPWKSGTRLRNLIDLKPGDPNERWQLDLEFRLMELFRTGYREFQGTEEGVLALRVLKAEPVGELLSAPVWELAKWVKPSRDALNRLMRYIAARNKDRETLMRHIEQLKEPRLEEAFMTVAEQYRAEGREEGHTAGSLGAQRRAVLRALEIRHGSVPPDLAARANALESGETLDELLEAAIRSRSLSEFERQLKSVE